MGLRSTMTKPLGEIAVRNDGLYGEYDEGTLPAAGPQELAQMTKAKAKAALVALSA